MHTVVIQKILTCGLYRRVLSEWCCQNLHSPRSLFDMPAPAGILSEGDAAHGERIPDDLVRRAVRQAYGLRGCMTNPRNRTPKSRIQGRV